MNNKGLGRHRWPGLFFALPAAALLALATGCPSAPAAHTGEVGGIDHRREMRTLVIEIGKYARRVDPSFLVVPQNGEELITMNGEPDGPLAFAYAEAIDGQGREDLFYGYRRDNSATPEAATAWILPFLDRAAGRGVLPMVTDYASDREKVDDSYLKNGSRGYLSFAAPSRELDLIPSYPPSPQAAHAGGISSLQEARNFLYLLNPDRFEGRDDYLLALDRTRYDLFIIDAFYGAEMLTEKDVETLQTKPGGGRRLVLAYLSIGEAEDYRHYWREAWEEAPPPFVAEENPDWPGNYKVRYWHQAWKALLFGSRESYLDRILHIGFDGVYLDIIDAYESWE